MVGKQFTRNVLGKYHDLFCPELRYNIEVIAEYMAKKVGRLIRFICSDVQPLVSPMPSSRCASIISIFDAGQVPIPERDFLSEPRMIVIRSFDVNKPGADIEEIAGGVAGGSILKGVLRAGQEIEVRPGIVSKDAEGKIKCTPILSRIMSLYAEENELQFAVPGGLIGVGTKIDPTLTSADRLVGQVLGEVGKLPAVYIELEINFFLLRRLLGVKTDGEKQGKVQKLTKGEILMVNIGSTSTGGRIQATKVPHASINSPSGRIWMHA